VPTKPTSDAGYLEAASRIIFMGGLNRRVVDSKWSGFRTAFHGFDTGAVAAMTPGDVEDLATDDRLIKYRAKLQAVVDNAETMVELAREHGTFGAYVDTEVARLGVNKTATELARQFAYISEQGALHWLYSTGYDIGPVTDKVRAKYAPFQADD
jgi:3-methyladenine DNA glycosylase Tag